MLLALVPTVISTTPTALSRFEPDKRRCYQDAEFNLPNLRFEDGYRYSHTNCLYQAVIFRAMYAWKSGYLNPL